VVFRLIQESVSNACKHADPSSIRVAVREDGDGVRAEVVDDGRGFEPATVDEGWGLRGMRERAAEVGGDLEIDSGARGTTVRLRLPRALERSA